MHSEQPLLAVNNLTHLYAPGKGFEDVSFALYPGEVLGIVGVNPARGKPRCCAACRRVWRPSRATFFIAAAICISSARASAGGYCAPSGAWCISIRWMACVRR